MKGIEWMINLLFWGVSSWLILSTFAVTGQEIEIIDGVETVRINWDRNLMALLSLLLLFSAALFYFNLWNFSRLGSSARRLYIVGISLLAFVGGVVLYLAVTALPYFRSFPKLTLGLSLSLFLFYFISSFGYGITRVWRHTEAQRRQLLLDKKQAELDLLRAQLQPHFLFNVLNNLLSMVDQQKDPALAASIDRLSGLLRHVVYDSTQEKIPIEKEIAFIRNYAELQLLRFTDEEVDLRLHIEGESRHWVEPGIFLPFVENAFKYGAAPEVHSCISLYFDLSGAEELSFRIVNRRLAGLHPGAKGGVGLAATKARLELVYPGKHQLSIQEDENFTVTLQLITS